jgi:hypothetical protein
MNTRVDDARRKYVELLVRLLGPQLAEAVARHAPFARALTELCAGDVHEGNWTMMTGERCRRLVRAVTACAEALGDTAFPASLRGAVVAARQKRDDERPIRFAQT